MNLLLGTFGGIVENVSDPERLGRVKVRVPHVYGASGASTGYIGTNDIPWAYPAGMPAGGSPNSGGFSHLPEIGDHVWVRFLDGEPEKPIWEWGMQTLSDAQGLPLHRYNENDKIVGKPKRAGWTRYGHTIELNPDSVLATTSQGYRLTLTDGDPGEFNGVIELATAQGNSLQMDDESGDWTLMITQDLHLQVIDEIIAQARALDLDLAGGASVVMGTSLDLITGQDINVDAGGEITAVAAGNISLETLGRMAVEAAGLIELTFTTLKMGVGTEPYVLGLQLTTFLTTLMNWLSVHVHTSASPGIPTSPPIVPPQTIVQPSVALLTSKTIFGQ